MIAARDLAVTAGKAAACRALGVSRATFYRRNEEREQPILRVVPRPSPRRLSEEERRAVLEVLHCERFADQGARAGVIIQVTPLLDEGEEVVTMISAPRVDDIVKRVMAECELWQERAQRALHMIIEQARGTAGYVYLLRDGELVMAASAGRAQAPDGLQQRVAEFIEQGGVEDEDANSSEMKISTETTFGDPTADGGRNKWSYRLMILNVQRSGRMSTVGAVALAMGEEPLTYIKTELLDAIATYL